MSKTSTLVFKLFEHLQAIENQRNETFDSKCQVFAILDDLNFEPSQKIVDLIINYSKLKYSKD